MRVCAAYAGACCIMRLQGRGGGSQVEGPRQGPSLWHLAALPARVAPLTHQLPRLVIHPVITPDHPITLLRYRQESRDDEEGFTQFAQAVRDTGHAP